MSGSRKIIAFQIILLLISSYGVWHYTNSNESDDQDGPILVVDSNNIEHYFQEQPSRVVLTNSYAATVMRMLDIDLSVVVGISGDLDDDELWPEFTDTDIVQNSAHSEIDYESLFDVRPDIYVVFATNGMVDTNAIREKLDPVGIKVLALDFYKYDSLRTEISVLANLFDKNMEKEKLFQEFDQIESQVAQRISVVNESERTTVVMEHHASLTRDPVVLTGTSQWTDIIHLAGGVNVFEDLPGHTTHVDMEAILDSNPDVLMFDGITFEIGYNLFDDSDKCQTHFDLVSDRPGFESMDSISNNRMMVMSGEFAGPMMIHGLPTLAKLLHPELFTDFDSEELLDNYYLEYHNIERTGKFVCKSTGI